VSEGATDPDQRAAPSEVRLRDGVRTCVLVFLAVRIGLSLLAVAGVDLIEPRPAPLPAVAGWPIAPVTSGWHNAVTGTERQDAARFLAIATHGYARDDGSAAFFPVYPLAVRVVAWIPGVGPLGAALLVSNLSFLVALILLHGLTRLEFDGSTSMARRSVLFLALFPTAFFFLAPYTESTFLLLSVAAFWFARRDRWGWAAVMAALAAATRSVGVLLGPALAIEALNQWRTQGRALLPRLSAAAATLLGPLAFFSYLAARFGRFWLSIDAQKQWDRHVTAPWTTLLDALRMANRYDAYWMVDALVVGLVLVTVVVGIRLLRPSYLTYAGLSLLAELSVPFPSRPLLSMPRFVAVIFPAFWVIAWGAERRRLPEALVTGVFACGWGILALLFMNWWHIF
jgi:Mannosyltransferase (PIG-V)